MRTILCLCGLVLLAGCPPREPVVATDDSGPDAADRAPVSRPATDPGVADLCREVAAHVRAALGVVAEVRTEARFESPLDGSALSGCSVVSDGALVPWDDTPTPDARVSAALGAVGWRQDPSFSADGPDETAGLLRRGGNSCFFWLGSGEALGTAPQGGDDPLPYRLTLTCTEG